jgi:uncharacterized membrane protein YphA (DoxX/SURF4 family)
MMNGITDELILAARLLVTTLFLIFGWRKLRNLSGTVSQMESRHYGRLLAIAHDRCGTIFDRCVVRYCRARMLLCLALQVAVHC